MIYTRMPFHCKRTHENISGANVKPIVAFSSDEVVAPPDARVAARFDG